MDRSLRAESLSRCFAPDLYRGSTVTVAAWVRADTARHARLQLHDGARGSVSGYHGGHGDWELLSTGMRIGDDAQELVVDVDAEGTETVLITISASSNYDIGDPSSASVDTHSPRRIPRRPASGFECRATSPTRSASRGI